MTPAQRWGRALVRSMKARGLTQRELAEAAGLFVGTVGSWCRGESLANIHEGMYAAEALQDDNLAGLLRALRTRTCATCGATFVAIRSPDARFCARSNCRSKDAQRGRLDAQMAGRLEVQRSATVSLRLHQQAIERMCLACEPEGVCRTSTCELRPVSPLKLADERRRVA